MQGKYYQVTLISLNLFFHSHIGSSGPPNPTLYTCTLNEDIDVKMRHTSIQ